MIISILNQKGGSGKTTLATNLARIFNINNLSTLLVDSDPQGSARNWHQKSDGAYVDLIAIDRPTLKKDVYKFSSSYEHTIIDGAPLLSDMASSAIYCSDLVLIPLQPSPYDVWATEGIVELVEQKRIAIGSPNVAFVLSRKIKKSIIARDVHEALAHFNIPVLENGTFQRIAYANSAVEGKSVMDWHDEEAKKDILGIYSELIEKGLIK